MNKSKTRTKCRVVIDGKTYFVPKTKTPYPGIVIIDSTDGSGMKSITHSASGRSFARKVPVEIVGVLTAAIGSCGMNWSLQPRFLDRQAKMLPVEIINWLKLVSSDFS